MTESLFTSHHSVGELEELSRHPNGGGNVTVSSNALGWLVNAVDAMHDFWQSGDDEASDRVAEALRMFDFSCPKHGTGYICRHLRGVDYSDE